MTALTPFIQQEFNGEIWRLEIDESAGNLLLETRNEAEKQVSFASVNLPAGMLNFSGYTTPERWLTGMEAAFNGVLLLHYYQSESGPAHKGIIAVNSHTGDTLWSNYTFAFDHLSVNGPVVYNTQMMPKKLYLADAETGAATRLYNAVIDTEVTKDIIVPDVISPAQLQGLALPARPYGDQVHYLEHNNFRILSLHTQNNGVLQQHLYVMDDDRVIYEDLLNNNIQKLQPEAFVLHKNWLICLKNKTALMVLAI